MNKSELSVDLAKVLNAHNVDTETEVPDFILSDMLVSHLETLIKFQEANERWHADDAGEEIRDIRADPQTFKRLSLTGGNT